MLNNNFIKKTNITKGFTLVEMLVSIAVFMVVMTVAVGSLISIIDANRKSQAIKNIINNINFTIESISKDMRMGTEYSCYLNGSFDGGDCIEGGLGVRYKSNEDKYVYYKYVSNPNEGEGNVQTCESDNSFGCSNSGWLSLTAPVSSVNITNMRFYVLNSSLNDSKQPRVIITMEGIAGIKDAIKTDFNMQTSISQRSREN